MTRHETAARRYRRLKADKLRHSQIAPSYTVPPVRCRCSHARLIHNLDPFRADRPACLSFDCGCTGYEEAD